MLEIRQKFLTVNEVERLETYFKNWDQDNAKKLLISIFNSRDFSPFLLDALNLVNGTNYEVFIFRVGQFFYEKSVVDDTYDIFDFKKSENLKRKYRICDFFKSNELLSNWF